MIDNSKPDAATPDTAAVDDPTHWLLTGPQRHNDASDIPVHTAGNLVEPLVHGAVYFDRLVEVVSRMGEGDHLFFTDWRGDPDERLRPDGPTVAELLGDAARRGVCVRGLVWRSHWDGLSFSKAQNMALDAAVEDAGGVVVLDQRVRRTGSHHQKFMVCRHPAQPEKDVAFAGGIDLGHTRRDDADHGGDPQAQDMNPIYGDTPAWHDVHLELRGPVVGVIDSSFRERWDDPTSPASQNPIAWLHDKWMAHTGQSHMLPTPLPDQPPEPGACGPHLVQTLRTYPKVWPAFPFAPEGERSVARGYVKALSRARRLIYVEDQYLWSKEVADLFAEALRTHPELHLVAIVPRYPDQAGAFSERPQELGRRRALQVIRRAGPEQLHVFDLENPAGLPVYVHAKVCVVDDTWATVGSDNLNRRSWSHDSELSSAVLDTTKDERAPRDPAGTGFGARTFARDLRLQLAREHLDRAADGSQDDDLLDPGSFIETMRTTAQALQDWYDGGRHGPRPPGRIRPHVPEEMSRFTRLWATPVYRLINDPDGRPIRLRLARKF